MTTKRQGSLQFDIVIIHDSIDRKLVDNAILPMLNKIGVGLLREPETQSVASAINKCQKAVIVISKDFLKSPCLTWETIVALEKLQCSRDRPMIALLVRGVRDIPSIPFLQKARKVKLDENKLERCIHVLENQIKVLNQRTDILPVSDIGYGLAWSYYIGYLKIVLPALRQQIRNCDWYKLTENRMPVKFYILLPESCLCTASLSDADCNIKFVSQLSTITKNRGGNVNHSYNAPVYSLQDETGQVYYCVVHYTMALSVLHRMETSQILKRDERIYQWNKFRTSLQKLINFPENKNLCDLVHLIPYNDESEDEATNMPSVHLLRAMKQDLLAHGISDAQRKEEQKFDGHKQSSVEYEVCICGGHEDIETIHRLQQFLKKNGFCVYIEMGCSKIEDIEDKFPVCRFFVFILSNSYLTKHKQNLNILSEIVSQVRTEARLIPLLVDVDLAQIPESLMWATYIDMKNERQYEERLLQILRGNEWLLSGHVPAVGVSYGLAWRFFTSYLAMVLPGIPDKLNSITEGPFPPIIKKLYGIIPKSCICWATLGDADQNDRLHCMGKVLISQTKDSATVVRCYYGNMYKVTSRTGKQYVIVGEYVSPVICLREMLDLAILTQEELQRELQRFMDTTHAILESTYCENIRSAWKFVFYDDSQETLSEALIREIEEDLTADDEDHSTAAENKNNGSEKPKVLPVTSVRNILENPTDICETQVIVNNLEESNNSFTDSSNIDRNSKQDEVMCEKWTETKTTDICVYNSHFTNTCNKQITNVCVSNNDSIDIVQQKKTDEKGRIDRIVIHSVSRDSENMLKPSDTSTKLCKPNDSYNILSASGNSHLMELCHSLEDDPVKCSIVPNSENILNRKLTENSEILNEKQSNVENLGLEFEDTHLRRFVDVDVGKATDRNMMVMTCHRDDVFGSHKDIVEKSNMDSSSTAWSGENTNNKIDEYTRTIYSSSNYSELKESQISDTEYSDSEYFSALEY